MLNSPTFEPILLKAVRFWTLTDFCWGIVFRRWKRLNEGSIFGGLQEVFWTYLWAKYHNSYMYLMTDYEIYDTLYPSVYVLASFWVCLATWLIYSLLVHGFFTCNACQSWMNLKIIFWLILVDYIMHLCLYLPIIQFLFSSWVYSLLVTKFTTKKTFQKP